MRCSLGNPTRDHEVEGTKAVENRVLLAATGLMLLVGCQEDRSQPLGPNGDPSHSLAANAVRVQETGVLAHATFFTHDPSTCIETDVSVTASQGRAKQGRGGPTPFTGASVSVRQFNQCRPGETLEVQGRAAGVLFRVNGRNSEAILRATIPAENNPSVEIGLDLVWSGSGKATLSSSSSLRQHTKSPGTSQSQVSTATFYGATASGTVSLAGLDVHLDQPPFAYIERFRSTSAQPDTGLASEATGSSLVSAAPVGRCGSAGCLQQFGEIAAAAQFRAIDESGCIESFSTVRGFEEREKRLPSFSLSSASVFQIDHCTGTSTLLENLGDAEGFRANNSHTEASLRATIPVSDFSGTEAQLEVDVAWTRGHLASRGTFVEWTKGTDCRFREMSKASIYNATATGTLTMNGMNLSPAPAFAAEISRFTDRQRASGGGCIDD